MRARKRFGQHFLEPAWVAKVVKAFDPMPDDAVVEIGPGRGALTHPLAPRVGRLLAVEVDRDLTAALEAEGLPNVRVISGDIIDIDLAAAVAEWQDAPFDAAHAVRVVGNLPYNISSPILFKLLSLAARGGIRDATLMIQQEVADRLVARPRTKEYGVLTIQTAVDADVVQLLRLPPGAFRPAPKVHSAVVQLRFRPSPVAIRDRELFTAMVRSVFTQRRKTILNALKRFADARQASAARALATAGLDPSRRPETLQLVELAGLADTFLIEN